MSHHNDDPSENESSPAKGIKETKIAIEDSKEEAKVRIIIILVSHCH